MTNTTDLFTCRYIPFSWVIGFTFIAIILTLLHFSQAEFIDLFSLQDWLRVLVAQPIYGWLTLFLICLVLLFVANTKIKVKEEIIAIEGFSIVFSILAERQKIEKLQFYNHAKSENWAFKSLFPSKAMTIEDEWKKSTLGFIVKPAYRSTRPIHHLWLGQLSSADRIQLIQVLQRHWDLDPKIILGMEQLSKLMRKAK